MMRNKPMVFMPGFNLPCFLRSFAAMTSVAISIFFRFFSLTLSRSVAATATPQR